MQLSSILGDIPWRLNWLMVIFMVIHTTPWFYFIVHMLQHHCDIFIMYWAVLAIPKLWVESHLVKSLVNFLSQGNITMVFFISGNIGYIAWAVLFYTSLHAANDSIPGLYCDQSSLALWLFSTDMWLHRLFCSHTGLSCCSVLALIYLGLVGNHSSHFWPYNDSH